MTTSTSPTGPGDTGSPTTVDYEVRDGVGTITIDRPDAMNSLDLNTKVQLRDAVLAAADDSAVRCVVLGGKGRAFCTGQDLKEHVALMQAAEDGSADLGSTVDEHYNPTVAALASMAKPVIAKVNGVAAGAGASLAFACDLRIVADTAGFNLAFANIALSCDTGSSATLQRLVGQAKAIELLYFPRTVKAEEALELGIATQVVPAGELDDVVDELARRLAAGPTLSYGSMRRAVHFAAEHPFTQALELESALMTETGATEDHRRAVAAFLAKEKPAFEGR